MNWFQNGVKVLWVELWLTDTQLAHAGFECIVKWHSRLWKLKKRLIFGGASHSCKALEEIGGGEILTPFYQSLDILSICLFQVHSRKKHRCNVKFLSTLQASQQTLCEVYTYKHSAALSELLVLPRGECGLACDDYGQVLTIIQPWIKKMIEFCEDCQKWHAYLLYNWLTLFFIWFAQSNAKYAKVSGVV